MEKLMKVKIYMKNTRAVWLCGLAGILIFVGIYGIYVLNPSYTDWLLTSTDGDLTQHYLGWKFYRHSPWTFPLGVLDTMAYPNRTSIIFTDSIPLFALVFKLFRFLLPAEFQYFGWWGLICFMLQGALGAILAKKYVKSDFMAIVAGIMFVLTPVFIDRMFWMTALSAHFLCLLGLLYLVYYDEIFWKTKKAVLAWGILGALCGSIHPYFLPMCGVILCGFVLIDLVRGKKKWKAALPLLAYLFGAVFSVFVFGGFGSGMKASNDGLGYYSFNLNGFFNPQGWSTYLKDLYCTDSQYEGFGYLGLGVLVLFICSSCISVGSSLTVRKEEKPQKERISSWCRLPIHGIAYGLIIVVLLILSASTVVMYGEKVLISAQIPQWMYKLWSVFRASGRLIWPVVYLIILGAVVMDTGWLRPRAKGLLLSVCLLLQFMDIRGALGQKNEVYDKVDQYQPLLTSSFWEKLPETDIRHIRFVSDVANSRLLLFSFGDYASDYGFTLSNFYFARSLGDLEIQATQKALQEKPEDTLFVYFANEAQRALDTQMNYYEVDGLIVGTVNPIPGEAAIDMAELSGYRFRLDGDNFFNNGENIGAEWVIHSYGNTYGPYLHAQPGRYKVVFTGSGLTQTDVKCYYQGGDIELTPQDLIVEDESVSYEVELTEAATDLEFSLWNVGDGDITISDIEIMKK